MLIIYFTFWIISAVCLVVTTSPLFQHSSTVSDLEVRDQFVYTISLSIPFTFFGQTYSKVYVSENGVVTFISNFKGGDLDTYTLDKPWITPFGANIGGFDIGQIRHETFGTTNPTELQSASNMINSVYTGYNFAASTILVITWLDVRKYPQSQNTQENTFQVALVADATRSFAIFLYEKIEWSPAVVGISAGDNTTQYTVCGSNGTVATTLPVKAQSECGTAGVFVFQVDGTTWTQSGSCTPVFTPISCTSTSQPDQSARDRRCALRRR